ncbi:elongation factor Ts [bacterium BMS3Abin04]|nr:elongation factor Ts [bacterium BMS3Abin04]
MAITAKQVKELRDKTGAGMMDCKKALVEADGNFDKAIEVLRKKGAAVAAKRAERSAKEGIVLTEILDNNSKGIILEINCETDFVAKSDDFVSFANSVMNTIVEQNPITLNELLEAENEGHTIKDALLDITGKIGEKIEISRFAIENAENGVVVDYVHHGSKLGVLITVDNANDKGDEFIPTIKDFAMQVAAMKPIYVYREEVPTEIIEKEKEIYKEVARKEGKPEQILERIAEGKLNKYFQENCLFEQTSIKDNTKTVGTIMKELNDKFSTDAKIRLFHRFHISDENK